MKHQVTPTFSRSAYIKALPLFDSPTLDAGIAAKSEGEATGNSHVIQPTVSVIVPAKNEAENLPYVLPLIPAWVYEVILVDGNSTDDTVQVAKSLWNGIRIVPQQGKGKGAALRTGFAAATGDIIVMLDADGSMNPGEISLYVGALLTGADFAKGSRFLQGGGTDDMDWLRYLGNWALTRLVRIFHGSRYSDLCYGYNAFWRRTLTELSLDADGFEIETQINIRILQANLKISEVPSFEGRRLHGISNLNTFRDGWRVLKIIINEWLYPQIKSTPPNLRQPRLASWISMPTVQPVYNKGEQHSVGAIGEG